MYTSNPEIAKRLDLELDYCYQILEHMQALVENFPVNEKVKTYTIFTDNQRAIIKQMMFLTNHIIGCKKTLDLPYDNDVLYLTFLTEQLPGY